MRTNNVYRLDLFERLSPKQATRVFNEAKRRRIAAHLATCHSHAVRLSGPIGTLVICNACGITLDEEFNNAQ